VVWIILSQLIEQVINVFVCVAIALADAGEI